MENLKLNDTISFYRKKQGLTQEELAQKIGVTNQSVSKWESAQCCPDISLIPKLAEIFEISIDELFGKKPQINDITAQWPMRDDDVIRIVVARGRKVMLVDDIEKTIDVSFPKNCNETTRQYFKVEVYGNICCDASINGDVIAHGQIECNEVNGDIKECKNNISCKGDIYGNVNADGNVSCGENVACGDGIGGKVNCGGSISCGGDINGDVKCGSNIECKIIEGNVECQGNIIYK